MSASSTAAVPQWKVEVWLYDLSQGLARTMSMAFLGKQIDAIYHTGVVVYGWESVHRGTSVCFHGTAQPLHDNSFRHVSHLHTLLRVCRSDTSTAAV